MPSIVALKDTDYLNWLHDSRCKASKLHNLVLARFLEREAAQKGQILIYGIDLN